MSEPDSFPTLQSIVLHEVQTENSRVRNSATEALLWLRRGLTFLKEFLSEVNAGEQDIHGALSESDFYDAQIYKQVKYVEPNACTRFVMFCLFSHPDNAYGKTLRQYHGWVVRGVFAVGISYSHQCFFSPLLRFICSWSVTIACFYFLSWR